MKTHVIFAVLILCGLVSAATSSYDLTVSENGKVLGVLILNGEGTVNVPLPLDVSEPVVEGGIYVKAENGIDITLTETASIIYTSDMMTIKQDGVWVLDLELPDTTSNSITVSLPSSFSVVESDPAAKITQTDDSKNLIWTLGSEDLVTVSYTTTDTGITTQVTPVSEGGDDSMLNIIIILLVVVVAVLAFVLLKKKKK